MNDIAIRARNVWKEYRLYPSPADRLADILGWGKPTSKIKVRQALRDVSFDVRIGEKVAIIGRNGAGKSTLLKLITRVTEPTRGELIVKGETRALLQIGTGFHPEFTGRQNVDAYLANMGVTGRRAAEMIHDAVTFAELEDHIDLPVKTYSTGQAMRLMFAASTMVKPDLLVVDEVLGVGDAYFQRKSFEHIREMCQGKETTLLLVTHDIYSAASLCDRMIWIDQGAILIDADPPNVTRAYEDAVREQEERRLRAKKLLHSEASARRSVRVIAEVQSIGNQPAPAPVHFARMTLFVDGVPAASQRFGADAFDTNAAAHLMREGANWGEEALVAGRLSRPLRTYGAPFHKVAGVFDLDVGLTLRDDSTFELHLEYFAEAETHLSASLVLASGKRELGQLPTTSGEWVTHVARPVGRHEDAAPAPSKSAASTEIESSRPPTWAAWTQPTSGADITTADDSVTLRWTGAAGPYLLESPPVPVSPQSIVVLPLRARIRSGALGFGVLDEAGAWIRTAELRADGSDLDINVATGANSAVRFVAYSASAGPLDADLAIQSAPLTTTDSGVNTGGRYGSGDVRIDAFRVYGPGGPETAILESGAPARFELDLTLVRPELRERPQIVLAFKRNGVDDMARALCDALPFDAKTSQRVTVTAAFDALPLGIGSYAVTILIAAEGYYDRQQTVYFTINPEVYCVVAEAAEIMVHSKSLAYQGTGAVLPTSWTIKVHAAEGGA